jgi:hypothetical protein
MLEKVYVHFDNDLKKYETVICQFYGNWSIIYWCDFN